MSRSIAIGNEMTASFVYDELCNITLNASTWLKEPCDVTMRIPVPPVKTFIASIITCLIVINNIINLTILRKMTSINARVKSLMASMSVSDLLLGVLVCVPGMVAAFIQVWPFSSALCQLTGMINGMSISVSMWSLTGITVERFFVIVQPIRFNLKPKLSHVRMGIAFIWIFNVFYYVLPIFLTEGMDYYVYQPDMLVCGFVWDVQWLFYLGGAIYPLGPGILIVVCSYKIIMVIRESNMKIIEMTSAVSHSHMKQKSSQFQEQHECSVTSGTLGKGTDIAKGPDTNLRSESKKNKSSADHKRAKPRSLRRTVMKREAKVSKVMIITAAAFFTCSLPYLTTATVEMNGVSISSWHSFSVMWLLNCNSFINVFIYSTGYTEFRQLFQAIFLPCYSTESADKGPNISKRYRK